MQSGPPVREDMRDPGDVDVGGPFRLALIDGVERRGAGEGVAGLAVRGPQLGEQRQGDRAGHTRSTQLQIRVPAGGQHRSGLADAREGGGGARLPGPGNTLDAGEPGDPGDTDPGQFLHLGRELRQPTERYTTLLPGMNQLRRPLDPYENVLHPAQPAGGLRDGSGVGRIEDGHRLRTPGEDLRQRAVRNLHQMAHVPEPRTRRVQGAGLRRVDGGEAGQVPGHGPDHFGVAADLFDHGPEAEAPPSRLCRQQRGIGLDGIQIDDIGVRLDPSGAVQLDGVVDQLRVTREDSVEEHRGQPPSPGTGTPGAAPAPRSRSARRRMSMTRSAPARIGLTRTVQSASSGASSRAELDIR